MSTATMTPHTIAPTPHAVSGNRPRLDQILHAARELGASDIHLVRGVAPAFRVNGEIRLAKLEPLDSAALNELLEELLDEKHRKILEEKWTNAFAMDLEPTGRPRFRGDYVLYRPAACWRVLETSVLDERVASDHRPVLAVLEWTGKCS